MQVAVTGARGEMGQGVVAELLAHDYAVIAIHRTPDLRQFRYAHQAENRVANLADSEATRAALEGCDALLHLAALPNPKVAAAPIVFANNMSGVFNVLQAASQLGLSRIVYASSQSALGNPWAAELQPLAYIPVDEEHPCRPLEAYGLSKLMGEAVCDFFARSAGLSILSYRLPAIWPEDQFQRRIDGRLTDQLQAAKSLWAYVDLRDAARACRLALEQDWHGHDVLNITSRWAFGAADIPELVRYWYPELADIRVPLESQTAVFEWRKAEEMLGFRSQYRWTRQGIEDAGT